MKIAISWSLIVTLPAKHYRFTLKRYNHPSFSQNIFCLSFTQNLNKKIRIFSLVKSTPVRLGILCRFRQILSFSQLQTIYTYGKCRLHVGGFHLYNSLWQSTVKGYLSHHLSSCYLLSTTEKKAKCFLAFYFQLFS